MVSYIGIISKYNDFSVPTSIMKYLIEIRINMNGNECHFIQHIQYNRLSSITFKFLPFIHTDQTASLLFYEYLVQ